MDKVKTATGKEFDCDFFSSIPEPPRLYLNIVNTTFSRVAEVFFNSAETVQLWCGQYYFAQFTRLVSISPDNGSVQVALAKE